MIYIIKTDESNYFTQNPYATRLKAKYYQMLQEIHQTG